MNETNPTSPLPEVIRERLLRLSELQEMGLLTSFEYELKKTEILAEAAPPTADTINLRESQAGSVWQMESTRGRFEVEVSEDHVSTRAKGREQETGLSCTIESYASRLGRGGQVRTVVEKEMPADAIREIDEAVKRRVRKSASRVQIFWLIILVAAVAYALLRR
jgi:hypothetical protein